MSRGKGLTTCVRKSVKRYTLLFTQLPNRIRMEPSNTVIVGYEDVIQKISDWLSVFKRRSNEPPPLWFRNALLLSGPTGVGKTYISHILCDRLGFDVIEFNSSDIRTSKVLGEKLSSIMADTSIHMMFRTVRKNAIILDEIDECDKRECSLADLQRWVHFRKYRMTESGGVSASNPPPTSVKKTKPSPKRSPSSQVEVVSISKPTTLRKQKQAIPDFVANTVPLIFICNELTETLKGILKDVIHISLSPPDEDTIVSYIESLASQSNYHIPRDAYSLLIRYGEYDFRKVRDLVHQLAPYWGSSESPRLPLHTILQTIGRRDETYSLDEGLSLLFHTASPEVIARYTQYMRKSGYADASAIYELDPYSFPLLLHENWIRQLTALTSLAFPHRLPTTKIKNRIFHTQLKLTTEFYESILKTMEFRYKWFGNWDLSGYMSHISCGTTEQLILEYRTFLRTLPDSSFPETDHKLLENQSSMATLRTFHKSSMKSKYSYRFYNMKLVSSVCRKLQCSTTDFYLFAFQCVYYIFVYTEGLYTFLQILKQHQLTIQEVERSMKLSAVYSTYERFYTKHRQKQLQEVWNSSLALHECTE